MNYSIIKSEGGEVITVLHDGDVHVARDTHPNYANIKAAVLADESDGIADLFDASTAVAREFERVSERVTLHGHTLYFDGDPVDNSLTRQVVRFLRDGQDFRPLVLFFEKVQQNPEPHSREQLFSWLKDRDFTITKDGDFLAYKGVNTDLTSIHAGPGIVNGVETNGNLDNSVGNIVEIPRSKVQHNPSVGCASGLHAGTWEYARGFGRGTVVTVRINPRDVVSVPTDSAAQKLRVSRYQVVEQTTAPNPDAVYDDGEDWDEDWDGADGDVYDVYPVASESDPNVVYHVTEYYSGKFECECPAYRYGSGNHCKHIRSIL